MSERDAAVDPFRRLALPLRALLLAGAGALTLLAFWLGFVVAVVLPTRDPGHMGMWTAIAVGFLGYAALTVLFVVRGPRPLWLRTAVYFGSVAAVAFGAYELYSMFEAARTGARFEGYLLVMGAILATHGLCAITYAVLTLASVNRVRAS